MISMYCKGSLSCGTRINKVMEIHSVKLCKNAAYSLCFKHLSINNVIEERK